MILNLISFRKLPFHSSNYCIFLLCLLTFNFISFSHPSLPFARCVCHPCRHPHQLQCARQGPGCAQYDAYIQKYDHWCGDADAAAGKPHNGRHLLHCRCGCHPRGRWSLQQAGGAAHRCAYPITGHRLHAVSTRKGGGTGWGEEWRFTRLGRRRGRGRFIVSLSSSFDCCHWDKATQQEML